MIDAAEFLNSKDIADYWREIGFAARCTPHLARPFQFHQERDRRGSVRHRLSHDLAGRGLAAAARKAVLFYRRRAAPGGAAMKIRPGAPRRAGLFGAAA